MEVKEQHKYFLLAWVAVLSCFFLIPFELYYHQKANWNYSWELPLGFALAGILVSAILLLVLVAVQKLSERLCKIICISLFMLGLLVFLADLLAPLSTELLDGRTLVSKQPLSLTFIEISIGLALLVLFLTLSRDKLLSLGFNLSVLFTIVSAVYLLLIIINREPYYPDQAQAKINDSGNVYHIVLDELQTDAALIELDRQRLAKQFNGFTLFAHNTANYAYTFASFPSYMSGTIYDANASKFETWAQSYRSSGILPTLASMGYQISMYVPRQNWNNQHALNFLALQDVLSMYSGHANLQFKDYIRLWFARLMPNFLTNRALFYGQNLAEYIYELLKLNKDYPDTIEKGIEPYSSVLTLKHLIDSEKTRPALGQYVYAHLILPHGPYVIDENCEYNPKLANKRSKAYLKQTACSLNLLSQFLAELKRLKRYHSSTIIIHSDTGHGHRGFMLKGENNVIGSSDLRRPVKREPFLNNDFRWVKNQMLARSLAVLMLKPRHAQDVLQYSSQRTQLIDIFPTILELLGLPNRENLPGRSVFSPDFPADREAKFHYFPNKQDDPNITVVQLKGQRLYRRISKLMENLRLNS